jgi:hypothetical protein
VIISGIVHLTQGCQMRNLGRIPVYCEPNAEVCDVDNGSSGAPQVPIPKTLEAVGAEAFAMPDRKRKPMELGIEFCLELVIVFYQLGRELMGLPVNVPLGAGCWAIAMIIAIRILWILPIMLPVPKLVKAAFGLVILTIAVWVSYNTVEEAFRKQRVGEQLSPDTKVVLGALSGIQRGLDILARPSASTSSHTESSKLPSSISFKPSLPIATVKPANPYELLSDAELVLVSKLVAKEIDDFMGTWRHQIEGEIEPRRTEQIYRHSPQLEEDERKRLEAEFNNEVNSTNDEYRSQAKHLFVRAEAEREGLVNHLAQKNSMPVPVDGKLNDLFMGLAATGPADSYDRGPSKVSAHLLELCKRLEQ